MPPNAPAPVAHAASLPALPLPATGPYINRLTPEILNILTPALRSGDFLSTWVYATQDHAHFCFERRGAGLSVHVCAYAHPDLERDLRDQSGCSASVLTGAQAQALRDARQASATRPTGPLPTTFNPLAEKDLIEAALDAAYSLAARQLETTRQAALALFRPSHSHRTLN